MCLFYLRHTNWAAVGLGVGVGVAANCAPSAARADLTQVHGYTAVYIQLYYHGAWASAPSAGMEHQPTTGAGATGLGPGLVLLGLTPGAGALLIR